MIGTQVLIVDFGGQYAHLICRRIRELGVFAELVSNSITAREIVARSPKGIVLSGGPASVEAIGAPTIDPEILDIGIPLLGICYGLQLIVKLKGGTLSSGEHAEFGRTHLHVLSDDRLFSGLPREFVCWMSHSDTVVEAPQDYTVLANTPHTRVAALADKTGNILGLQFHPEVSHTEWGKEILRNFVFGICKCREDWDPQFMLDTAIRKIKETAPVGRVICAISGGVDSLTTCMLVHIAVGERLFGIFVDTGLMRKGEPERVKGLLGKLGIPHVCVDGSQRFIGKLIGIKDPEEKRRVIGEEFARVFEEQSESHGPFQWLAQGTLYPDVIESARAGPLASRIKSHHNVAGLPEWLSLELIEPLRDLYKDEVRRLAKKLDLPNEVVNAHPFPGPGLAVRIIGEVTTEKLEICREASYIVEEVLKRRGIFDNVWQAFAVVGDDKAIGVMGDERRYGYVVSVRVVSSEDGMTADWVRLPHDVLEEMGNTTATTLKNVTWVNYCISSKPPSTIEPQ